MPASSFLPSFSNSLSTYHRLRAVHIGRKQTSSPHFDLVKLRSYKQTKDMGLALNEVKGSFFPSQHSTGLYYFVLKNDLDPPPSLQPPSAVQRDAPQLQEQVPPQHLMLLITKLRLTPEQTPRPNPIITPQPPSLGRILTLLAIKLPPCITTACHSS